MQKQHILKGTKLWKTLWKNSGKLLLVRLYSYSCFLFAFSLVSCINQITTMGLKPSLRNSWVPVMFKPSIKLPLLQNSMQNNFMLNNPMKCFSSLIYYEKKNHQAERRYMVPHLSWITKPGKTCIIICHPSCDLGDHMFFPISTNCKDHDCQIGSKLIYCNKQNSWQQLKDQRFCVLSILRQ